MRLKPKVFISHSKKDIDFVDTVVNILRKVGIDSWIDDIDIPHGDSWLNSIFKSGIEESDLVFVYLTANSIESLMVQKELDAALIGQLDERRIRTLLYVSEEDIRKKLRSDIQSLQIPVLNAGNLQDMIPRVVSEIWNNYATHKIDQARYTSDLKARNAELELEAIRSSSDSDLFTVKEEKEFALLESRMSERIKAILHIRYDHLPRNDYDDRVECEISKLAVFIEAYNLYSAALNEALFQRAIEEIVENQIRFDTQNIKEVSANLESEMSLMKDVLLCGFGKRSFNPQVSSANSASRGLPILQRFGHSYEIVQLSDKADRFVYWLTIQNRKANSELELRYL